MGKLSSTHCNDSNDVLRQNGDMGRILTQADVMPHDGVVNFDAIPGVNGLLKGNFRDELTILSGHTVIGNTTLLSQLSLDYCLQGVPTMWGSF